MTDLTRRDVLAAAASAVAVSFSGASYAADDRADIQGEIVKRHDEALRRLQDWIKVPSIAADPTSTPLSVIQAQLALFKRAGFDPLAS